MRRSAPRLSGGTVGNRRAKYDQRGPFGFLLGFRDREVDRLEVIAVVDMYDVPAIPLEARRLICRRREVRGALDRDPVVVEDPDELAELLVSRDGRGLVGDSLHHITVGAEHIRPVIDDLMARAIEVGGEPALGQREADRVRHSLTERPGRRLHSGDVSVFRMTSRRRTPLTEVPNVLFADVVPAEMQERVDQHGRVTDREDEAITIEPAGIRRVVVQVAVIEHVTHRCQRHGRARVSRVRLLHRIHGKDADRIDRQLFGRAHCPSLFS